jgi:hypothetical protein
MYPCVLKSVVVYKFGRMEAKDDAVGTRLIPIKLLYKFFVNDGMKCPL